VREADGPVYIRLVSVPWELPFDPPDIERLERGRGTVLREGSDGVIVTTGPVMVDQAWRAAELLERDGSSLGVVALPWLRGVDGAWIAERAGSGPVITLDNHYISGGQGEAVLGALAELDDPPRVVRLGVESVPACGTNDEVLRAHRLDAQSVAERVAAALPARA
jgi:transketolase